MRISDWSSDVCSSDLRSATACSSARSRLPSSCAGGCGAGVLRGCDCGVRRGCSPDLRPDVRWRAAFGMLHPHDAETLAGGRLHDPPALAELDLPRAPRFQPRGFGIEVVGLAIQVHARRVRSDEHTSELQSLMRISYAVFCLKKKNNTHIPPPSNNRK